jgi:hypothetical protein
MAVEQNYYSELRDWSVTTIIYRVQQKQYIGTQSLLSFVVSLWQNYRQQASL